MAAMAHSIQGFPIINLFHPGEVLQSMDLVAQSLADGQPLPVEQYVDLETRGLETVLIQEEGEVWFSILLRLTRQGPGCTVGLIRLRPHSSTSA